MTHFVYMLRCADDSLYCGYTTDLMRRIEDHNSSKVWAKYTRSRRPVELVYHEVFETASDALKRECAIKRLTRAKKLLLITK